MILLIIAWCLTTVAACAGIFASDTPVVQRRIVPVAGGLLAGIAIFCILPELAEYSGWRFAVVGTIAGAVLLQAFNRYVYPVCPICSHSHDHAECATRLHGFAAPLLIAVSIHCVFDGWALALSMQVGLGELRRAMLMGLLVHKLPEGLVLGLLLRSAMRSRWRALLGAAGSQSAMFAALLLPAGVAITSARANVWFALATGSFLFLGAHAVHSEWRDRGPRVAMRSAVAGVAGSLVVAGVARLFSH